MTQLALKLGGYEIKEDDAGIFSGGTGWKFGPTTTLADLINAFVPVLFVIAGIVLLFMLIGGGFTIFLSTGNPEKIKKGTGTITSALIGFTIMFASYWIIRLLEITFGLSILA